MKSTARPIRVKVMREVPGRVHDNQLSSGQAGHLVCSQGNGMADVSAKHHCVDNGEEMWSVFVGHTEKGAEIRDATSRCHHPIESRLRPCSVLEVAKVLNRHRSKSREARDRGSIDDTDGDRVCPAESQSSTLCAWPSHSVGMKSMARDYAHDQGFT